MKKYLALFLAAAMTLGIVGCTNNGGTAKDNTSVNADKNTEANVDKNTEPTANTERTTFTVGFDASFPPYGYMDENGEYVGFDLSLAQEVCNRLGWELVKQPINWDAKDAELSSGTIDCIWNGFTINGREDLYTWSDPYVDNSQVYVVPSDSGIKSVADLAGKVVLVQADSSALHALEKMPEVVESFGELTQVPEYNTAFMSLESGAGDAVAMDIAVAKYQIDSRDGKFVILEDYISSEQYGVGFLLGNDELKNQVQDVLYEMLDDGTFMRIAEEWNVADYICFGK